MSDVVHDSKRERIFLADRANPTTYVCTNLWLLSAWVNETSTENGCKAWQRTPNLDKWPSILLKLAKIFASQSQQRRDVLKLLWNLTSNVDGVSLALKSEGNEWFVEMLLSATPTSAKHLEASGILSVLGIVRELQVDARIKLVKKLQGTKWIKILFQMCQGFLNPKSSLAHDTPHDECALFAHAAISTLLQMIRSLFLLRASSDDDDDEVPDPDEETEHSALLADLGNADILDFVCSLLEYAQRNDDNGASSSEWSVAESPYFTGDCKRWAVEQAVHLLVTCTKLATGSKIKGLRRFRALVTANVLRSDRGVLSRLFHQMQLEENPMAVVEFAVATAPFSLCFSPHPDNLEDDPVRDLLLQDKVFVTKVVEAMTSAYAKSTGQFTGDHVQPDEVLENRVKNARNAVMALRCFAEATGAPGLEQLLGAGALDVTKHFVIKYLDFCMEKRRSINGGTYEDKIGHFLDEALGFFRQLASWGDRCCEAIFDLETMQKFRAVDQSFLSSLVTKRVTGAVDLALKSFENACPSLYYQRQRELSKKDGEVPRLRELEKAKLKAVRDELGIACELPKRPLEHFCPLTQEVMVDPVMLGDGYFYEREALEKFFAENDKTSPVTGEKMPPLAPDGVVMVPSKRMKSLIDEWERASHRAYIDMHCAITGALKEEAKKLKEAKKEKSKNKGKKRAADSDDKPKKKKKVVVASGPLGHV